jgi:hypothetical protein
MASGLSLGDGGGERIGPGCAGRVDGGAGLGEARISKRLAASLGGG